MTPQPAPEPDWGTIGSGILRRLGRLGAPREWLEDAAQDALVCMLVLMNGGGRIENRVAFGVDFTRKRWIDELRRQRRRAEDLEPKPDMSVANSVHSNPIDWPALLRGAGWEPTQAWSRILDAISSGTRGTRSFGTGGEPCAAGSRRRPGRV
ncbi:hypothetical protein LBMAG49_26260 [Planctomycetota bacterium]|nr:hypothetical protein LBMAG49_26260 [Planctomycetota bacterium]